MEKEGEKLYCPICVDKQELGFVERDGGRDTEWDVVWFN